MRFYFFIFLCSSVLPSFGQRPPAFNTGDYVKALKECTDVMVNDVTSPVAAARYYSYITIAANEILESRLPAKRRLSSSIKDFHPFVFDSLQQKEDLSFAAILSIYKTAVRLLPSGYLLKPAVDSLIKLAGAAAAPAVVDRATRMVDSVVAHIGHYAALDGFSKLSGMRRYTPIQGEAYWTPTQPGFMQALEPYWGTLRLFTLDSADQFTPAPPEPYSRDTSSRFYAMLKEVYLDGGSAPVLTSEKLIIGGSGMSEPSLANQKLHRDMAMFWDCNPYALQQMGHVEFGLKKISPGGHWMGITGIACIKKKVTLQQAALVHTLTALAISDGFVSCWSEKFRSNRVRPETAIRALIDPRWTPLLQTPPFPEYTSGHSVISMAAATVLTKVFGNKFSFTDNTESEFELEERQFKSFLDAANEASISRLYGGIHYRDAIVNGMKQGAEVGHWVLKTAGDKVPRLNR